MGEKTAPTPERVEYFFMITLQLPVYSGFEMNTFTGTVFSSTDAATRYKYIRDLIAERSGAKWSGATVVACHIERN